MTRLFLGRVRMATIAMSSSGIYNQSSWSCDALSCAREECYEVPCCNCQLQLATQCYDEQKSVIKVMTFNSKNLHYLKTQNSNETSNFDQPGACPKGFQFGPCFSCNFNNSGKSKSQAKIGQLTLRLQNSYDLYQYARPTHVRNATTHYRPDSKC